MATIVTRAAKGSALTFQEGDANFVNLNTDKIELSNLSAGTSGDGSLTYNNTTGAFTYAGPGVAEYRGAFSAGTGITVTEGVIASTVSAGIADVVSDTTPQLGGNLDVNGQQIVSVSNGNIVLAPNGVGKSRVNNINYNETPHTLGTAFSGTVAPDVANGNVQTLQINGNIVFNGFTNPVAGQSVTLILFIDGAGLTLTSNMLFAGGDKTLSATAATDIISVYYNGSFYFASLSKGFA